MDNVNFPPPPPMVGTPEKRNMNKFCDYHQDRGHNTNDCYHLKKQIEEEVASGRLAHLVKDIRQGSQKSKGSANRIEKVINMASGSEGYMLMVVALQRLCTSIVSEILAIRREVTMGECGKTRTVIMEFVVVKGPSLYNALLGRTRIRSLGAVASTIHSMIKFLTSNEIATIATTRETLRECRKIKEAQALSRHAYVTDPSSMQTSSKVTNPRVSLAPVETRSRKPRKEPMQLDGMEKRRQLGKRKKLPKSSVKEKIVVNDNYPE
ncbi:hypothetical protein Tco_1225483 [Tanacetum coccineum]